MVVDLLRQGTVDETVRCVNCGMPWAQHTDGTVCRNLLSEIERLRSGIQEALDNIYSGDVFMNLAKVIEEPDEPTEKS